MQQENRCRPRFGIPDGLNNLPSPLPTRCQNNLEVRGGFA
jgi:hypothetical protein